MGKASKRDRKKAVIQKYLPKCTNTWSVYTYGNIPQKCIDGALSSYAGYIEYDDVFGLIDETIFGSGKKGMIFSCDGFYTDWGNGFHKYADYISFTTLANSYNLTAMNEMLTKLYEIEAEPSGWDIAASLLGGAFSFLQEMAANEAESSEDEETDSDEYEYSEDEETDSDEYEYSEDEETDSDEDEYSEDDEIGS